MKVLPYLLAAVCSSLLACPGASAEEAIFKPALLDQKKLDFESPKVAAIYWSLGEDGTFPTTSCITFIFPASVRPKTLVWLLKADGTVISPEKSAQDMPVKTNTLNDLRTSIGYIYSRTGTADAVAVTISIDGHYFTESLLAADPWSDNTPVMKAEHSRQQLR